MANHHNHRRRSSTVLEVLDSKLRPKKDSAFSNLTSDDFRKGVHAVKEGFHKDISNLFETKQSRVVGRGKSCADGVEREVLIFENHSWGFSKDYVKVDGPRSIKMINKELEKIQKESCKDGADVRRTSSIQYGGMADKDSTVAMDKPIKQASIQTQSTHSNCRQNYHHDRHDPADLSQIRRLSFHHMERKGLGSSGQSQKGRKMPGSFLPHDETRPRFGSIDEAMGTSGTTNAITPSDDTQTTRLTLRTESSSSSSEKLTQFEEADDDQQIGDLTAVATPPEPESLSPTETMQDVKGPIPIAGPKSNKSQRRKSWFVFGKSKSKTPAGSELTSLAVASNEPEMQIVGATRSDEAEYDFIKEYDKRLETLKFSGENPSSTTVQIRRKRWSSRW